MKLRLLAVAAAVLAFGYLAALGFSEDQSPAAGQSTSAAPGDKSASPAPTIEPADPDKVKHDGGKDDIDAVGNRNVGCKTGVGNWVGVEKQIAMGKQAAQQVEAQMKLVNDPVVGEYVNRANVSSGKRLERSSVSARDLRASPESASATAASYSTSRLLESSSAAPAVCLAIDTFPNRASRTAPSVSYSASVSRRSAFRAKSAARRDIFLASAK